MRKTTKPQTLDQIPVQSLKGVGPKMAEKLAGLDIHNVQDLLFHLPLRYQDRTRVTAIGALQAGQEAVIEGEIRAADVVFGRRRSLVVRLQDGSGTITLRFFHFTAQQKNNLAPGTRLRCYGEVRFGPSGVELYHPQYQRAEDIPASTEDTLTPVYPSTEGLHQATWRKLSQQALEALKQHPPIEWLPQDAINQWPSLAEALAYLHAPPPHAQQQQLLDGEHPAQQRLALEELVAHHLSLLKLRQQWQVRGAPAIPKAAEETRGFMAQLPFGLTGAQQHVLHEIYQDIEQHKPMLRLVQGDVGSGKTLVAALACLQAVAAGYQVAVMAPTEILAEQHRDNFARWFEPMGYPVAWLVGRLKGKARANAQNAIATGEARVVVGTHALFQDDVHFQNLALIVVDEQHRFGVHQRLQLREKGVDGNTYPHQLVMTATPIPRTLAMTAYADLDCSVIDELPPGRTPVKTLAIANNRRPEVIERVRAACMAGEQTYWVCTLIEESEVLQAQAAEKTAEELQTALPELNIGLVHGRLKADEKAAVMDAFKAGDLQLLVATTVIEVGVDVPNASLMILENPERLGLAQLHQLRGRVGRGSRQSHCVLLYQSPLSQNGKARIQVMRDSNDGFVISEKDLELRGPGEVLGTRQTGLMQFRIADLMRDAHLIDRVHEIAAGLIENMPASVDPLINRWIARDGEYGEV